MIADYLRDIIKSTHSLGIGKAKIEGDHEKTMIGAVTDDRTVIVSGTLNQPIEEFRGMFGIPNIGTLNTIVNTPEYAEGMQLSVKHTEFDGAKFPESAVFSNSTGDFTVEYRFMSPVIAREHIKTAKLVAKLDWSLTVTPTIPGIQRLKYQAAVHNTETWFTTQVNKTQLVMGFGDHSTHSGTFVFDPAVTGTLKNQSKWPVNVFIKILDLPGDKTIDFSDQGMCRVTVNTGLGIYEYYIPAWTK
jgi:hypothetical protein